MKDLILDLQGNGGGYLNAAIDLANEFLQQKTSLFIRKAEPHAAVISMPKETESLKTGVSSFWWMNIPHPPVKS